jgi:cytochrome c5
MAKGMDAMVASVNKGLNAMPPKGMCFDCTDADYAALIQYMSAPAK